MARIRRGLILVAGLAILAVLTVGITIAAVETGCRGTGDRGAVVRPIAEPRLVIDEPGYRRDAASTYFTFPEWYIVYAAEDLGRSLETGRESTFPYLGAVAGFWSSFCTIKRRTRGWAEPELDVAVMIYTIGFSFSAEYAVKSIYEGSIGRLTEWLGGEPTAEDGLAARAAADYARFLYATPWYQYPFMDRLHELWRLPAWGPGPIRKWERRLALSAEFLVKAGYGWAIQRTMDATGGEDQREIMAVMRGLTTDDLAAEPRLRIIDILAPDTNLVILPRYQVFTDIVVALSRKGREIPEVAGNSRILLTALLPGGATSADLAPAALFTMPLSSRPGWRRAGFDVALRELPGWVARLDAANAAIEHLFDY